MSRKPISALVLVSGDKPMKTKEDEGQIEVADFAIRHKYLETALKIRGDIGENKSPINIEKANIVMYLPESPQQIS